MDVWNVFWLGKAVMLTGWFFLLAAAWRTRRPAVAAAAVLWLGGAAIFFELYPSPEGYSLPCNACDQGAYVAIARGVAEGNSPFNDHYTGGVPQMLPYAYSALAGWVGRATSLDVVAVHQYGAVPVFALLVALFYRFGYRSMDREDDGDRWIGVLMVALFAFASSPYVPVMAQARYSPGGFLSHIFFAKPGHLLSYGFIPGALWFMAGRGRSSAMAAGVSLGLAGLFYLPTAMYVGYGLVCYVLLTVLLRPSEIREAFRGLCTVATVSLAVSSPYWLPIMSGLARRNFFASESYYDQDADMDMLLSFLGPEKLLFPLFALAVVGAVVLVARRTRIDLLILSLPVGLVAAKAVNYLSLTVWSFPLLPMKVDLYYFNQILALPGAVGLHTLVSALARWSSKAKVERDSRSGWLGPGRSCVLFLLLATPILAPVAHVTGYNPWAATGTRALPTEAKELYSWMRSSTCVEDVILAEPGESFLMNVYTGRKMYVPVIGQHNNFLDHDARNRALRGVLDSSTDAGRLMRGLSSLGVGYVVIDGGPDAPGRFGIDALDAVLTGVEPVFRNGWYSVYATGAGPVGLGGDS